MRSLPPRLGEEARRRRRPEHAGPLVHVPQLVVVVVEQLAVGRLVLGRLDPVARHDAGKGDADAGSAVEPARAGAARQALAEVGGEVVAVLGQEVIGRAGEGVRGLAQDGVDLGGRGEAEAVQQLGLEGAARRLGLGLGPVDARDVGAVVAAVGVLAPIYDDARVQQRRADGPEKAREPTRLWANIVSGLLRHAPRDGVRGQRGHWGASLRGAGRRH